MAVKTFSDRPVGFNEYTNHLGQTIRVDPTKAHNLFCLLESAKGTNGDVVLIYDGEEGSGKSTAARQDARLLDPTLDETRIEFNPEDAVAAHFKGLPEKWDPKEYMLGHYENKPWQAIILDESAKLDRKRTMSAGSVEFTGFASQSRQLHKIFFIVLPNIHMLDGYVAEHRALALIHCYKHEKEHLGFYKWYTRRHLRAMFSMDMHKRKLYPRDCSFMGRFTSRDPFDLTRYDQKKAAALNAYRRFEGLVAVQGLTPEAAVRIMEDRALKNAVEKGLVELPIYTALEIPPKTWKERKTAAIAAGLVNKKSKIGTPKRLADAVAALNERSTEKISI